MLPNVAKVASLIGDPVRSRMLFSLLDGCELSASELALRGGASAQSASAHLQKLVGGGLLNARTQGRQRFFSLASKEIAQAIEILAVIAPKEPVRSLEQHTLIGRLRVARTCYDHLAGRLGVGVTDFLTEKRFIVLSDRRYTVTESGESFLSQFAIRVEQLSPRRRPLARPCVDWTERRNHLAGSLGSALLDCFLSRKWVLRNPDNRALGVSAEGKAHFLRVFGVQTG